MTKCSMPFVLDGFPRTGSTTLTRVLNKHPDINCCMEPFHPKRYGGSFNSLAKKNNDLDIALQMIRLRWNALKHVWEPGSGWPFVGQKHLNDCLVMQAEVVVSLRRRNLLRQYVSGFISKSIGFWVGKSEEFYARLDNRCLTPIDIAEATAVLSDMSSALAKRDELLGSLPSKQLVLYYEDLFETATPDEQISYCNSLFEELGHEPIDDPEILSELRQYFDPLEYKWSSNDVYMRIPGIRLLDEKLGNDATGRIFL